MTKSRTLFPQRRFHHDPSMDEPFESDNLSSGGGGSRGKTVADIIRSANQLLDDETRQGINGFDVKGISDRGGKLYNGLVHGLLFYGVDAVTLTHIMRMARGINRGSISLDDFADRYGLCERRTKFEKGLSIQAVSIEQEGIFVPQPAYSKYVIEDPERTVALISRDYTNLVSLPSWIGDKKSAMSLIERKWRIDDFSDSELINQGEAFGENMWRVVEHQARKNLYFPNPKFKPPEADLALKLLEYYSAILIPPK